MTLMLTCLKLCLFVGICCTRATLKLLWFTDSVAEFNGLFL